MPVIADPRPAVTPPPVIAGLLLLARDWQQQAALPHATVADLLAKTGAKRSAAYVVRQRLEALLPTLARPVGRPPAPPAPPPAAPDALTRAVLRFVMDHPGCVHGSAARRQYAACFRRFLLELRAQHAALDLAAFAVATGVPLDTLRDWERVPAAAPAAASPPAPDPARPAVDPLHIETVLAAWQTWEGDLAPFCTHVREHLLVPFGRTAITAILAAHGVHQPQRRAGRSPDESALRKSFETFFPGAQWVGDGTPVTVTLEGERFAFNFELIVDAASAACVGASIRDAEDGPALTDALADGVTTTGAPPLALLVDNRPSNLTPEVAQTVAAAGTVLIPATSGRPQNKGHVEGAFGLFFQMLPALALAAATPRELARQILRLVIMTWARTLNGRPRATRGGRSRRELYDAQPPPTPDEIATARAALEARLRRQLAARQTAQARLDPLVRQLLAAAFARLGFADPDGQLQTAIARYPLAAIVDGIAIFDGKHAAGTLPPDVDARYLLGIVRHVAHRREAEEIAAAMLRARLAAQDAILAPLVARHQALVNAAATPAALVVPLVDAAVLAHGYLDRLFWLRAAGDGIRAAPAAERPTLYTRAARIINAAASLPHADRLEAARCLAHRAFPLA